MKKGYLKILLILMLCIVLSGCGDKVNKDSALYKAKENMVNNVDNYNNGYGQEIRTLANLNFSQSIWNEIKEKMLHFSGAKGRVFEFEKKNYSYLEKFFHTFSLRKHTN